jgi:hypothetical protein
MRRFWIILLAVAMAIVIALPAAAVKPDKPEKPGKPDSSPTNPPACEVPEATEQLYDEEGLVFAGAGEYNIHWINLTPAQLADRGERDLCVEVTVKSGTLGDMNVALTDYDDQAARRCGFYWPGGKINEGDVFNVGFSLDGYTGQSGFCGSDPGPYDGLAVLVMPKLHAKTDAAILHVRIGFADVAP